MAITIVPQTEEDVPAAVRLQLDAFRDHPRTAINWPFGYTDEVYAFYESNRQKDFHDPECKFFKAIDAETGQMIGQSEWTFSLKPSPAAPIDDDMPLPPVPDNFPREGNWALRQWFKRNSQKLLQEYFPNKPYILLDILTVSPRVQAKGIGSSLLQWGVEQADELGLPIGLESTPSGLKLYKKFGFREERLIEADLKQFGMTKEYNEEAAQRVWMIRPPRPRPASRGRAQEHPTGLSSDTASEMLIRHGLDPI